MIDEAHRVGDLELNADLAFPQQEWRIHRVGWVITGLIIVLALLGVTGSGVLVRTAAGDRDGLLQVDDGRFDRLQATATLVARFATAGPSGA